MKWIFWIVWIVICALGIILEMLGYTFINIFIILWDMSLKDLLSWEEYKERNIPYFNSPEDYGFKTIGDKNPWITYKRWTFL